MSMSLYMHSAARKSVIQIFVKDVIKSFKDSIVEFHLCENTFDKMVTIMENNNVKIILQFDEDRHFFSIGTLPKGIILR